jgi:putative hemolysin
LRLGAPEEASSRIPARGPVIIVANHPTGGMDGILLMSFLRSIRPDVKALSHVWFQGYSQLAGHMFFVDPEGGNQVNRLNARSMKAAARWVRDGHLLLVFPAGQVSYPGRRTLKVIDPPWKCGLASLIRLARPSVVPVYLHGRNSWWYYLVSLISPRLRGLLLARELLNKRGKTLGLQVGDPISFPRLAQLATDEERIRYLREATYGCCLLS